MWMMKRWLSRRLILSAAAVCVLSAPITAAQAALVTYSFTGSIPGTSTSPDTPVSGSFQFNNATSGSGGVYNGAVTGFTLDIGGIYTSSFIPGANAVTISQNMALGFDRWALVTAATGGAINGPLGSSSLVTPFSFDLRFDLMGGGLSTNLQDYPSLGSLNGGSARWRLFFEDADGKPSAYLGSMTLTAVPLPAAVLLFGAGLISLVGLGAGGLRNLRGPRA